MSNSVHRALASAAPGLCPTTPPTPPPPPTVASTTSPLCPVSQLPPDFSLRRFLGPDAPAGRHFHAHADDLEMYDLSGMSSVAAMVAGATAGMAEHLVMFPIDTIKTRMQQQHAAPTTARAYASVVKALGTVISTEGATRLYRGLPAALVGAVPAHAAHFATYEALKTALGATRETHTPLANSIAGFGATCMHDAISTPLDVVKQRLQVAGSPFTSISQCARSMWAAEGLRAFYASYPTTVLLNIPYMLAHFTVYEGCQTFMRQAFGRDHTPLRDIAAGAAAGAAGGLISNPLDVLRTRIQTQDVAPGRPRLGGWEVAKEILAKEGVAGFAKGAKARVLLFTPSAAICWGVYETMKRVLVGDHHHHHHHHGDHDDHHHGHDHGHGHEHGHGHGHGRGQGKDKGE